MKVAAFQAALGNATRADTLASIRGRVEHSEAKDVAILCCPEAILGGLADNHPEPARIAIPTRQIASVLVPLASDRVTTIIGLTELADDGRLYNAAVVWSRGDVAGIYRKRHPAIRTSVYSAGNEAPVFCVAGLTFGIIICNDSNFAGPAARIAAQGATVLFVPTNNALPAAVDARQLAADTRRIDIACATGNGAWIVRADVAGRSGTLMSSGSSGVVRPDGSVLLTATAFAEDLLIADIESNGHTGGRARNQS